MTTRALWVVTYDICEDSVRRSVARILLDHGRRIQWSVFECWLAADQKTALRDLISAEVDPSVDRIRWFPVCGLCQPRIHACGPEVRPDEDQGFVIL